jgi:hypothetical protein
VRGVIEHLTNPWSASRVQSSSVAAVCDCREF